MNGAPLAGVGISVAGWFNESAYDAVAGLLAKYNYSHPSAWPAAVMAWNAVAFRAKAAVDYDETFSRLVRVSTSPVPEDRYAQEAALFGFFASVVSAVECCCFAAYCIGSIADPQSFPVGTAQALKVFPKDVADRFGRSAYAGDALSVRLAALTSDAEHARVRVIRDVLTHRGSPPRRFFHGCGRDGQAMLPGDPKAPADQWQYDFAVDVNTTKDGLAWLATTLADLLDGTEAFCRSRLP